MRRFSDASTGLPVRKESIVSGFDLAVIVNSSGFRNGFEFADSVACLRSRQVEQCG